MDKRISVIALLVMALLPFLFSIATAHGVSGNTPAAVEQKIMTTSQAVVLGVVEGVTEYLPVSSTGHLLLAEKMLGISRNPYLSPDQRRQAKGALDAYTICIQVGAILAVLWLYFGRLKQIVRGISGNDAAGRRLLLNVAAGFLPAAVIGLLFNSAIKTYLFGPWPVVAAWLIGGVAILAVSRRNRRGRQESRFCLPVEDMTWRMALIIGFAQCIAMWPGVSRSLVTIMGGLLVGLTMEAAVEYSFLLGVVTLGAATAYDVLKHGRMMLQIFDHYSLIIGVAVAFLAALVSVKWMVRYLSRHGLEVFGYYRVAIAAVTTVFLLTAEKIWI